MHLINSSKRLTGLAAIACAAALTPVAALAATAYPAGSPGFHARPARPATAYVISGYPGIRTMTPISTATGKPGKPIKVGGGASTMAITPNGKSAAVTAPAASAAAKAAAAPGAAAGAASSAHRSRWQVRTVLRESAGEQIVTQVVDPRAGADYALVPRLATPTGPVGPYRLQRTDLATGAVRNGPEFTVTSLTLADGYLWVSGDAPAGRNHSRLLVYQVNPATLAVFRSRQLRRKVLDGAIVTVTAGPRHTIWVGFLGRMLRIDTRTGATMAMITLPRGAFDGGAAVDLAGRYLYVAAQGGPAYGGDVFEYGAGSGRLLASNSHHPLQGPCDGCAALTAVPGGVWASLRTGTEGHSVLFSQRGLRSVPLSGSIFGWDMAPAATTVYGGGALWLATGGAGAIGCIAPNTGVIRHQTTLTQLKDTSGELLAVNASAHEIYARGTHGVIAITPPRSCWA